jgi:hypothetical protein
MVDYEKSQIDSAKLDPALIAKYGSIVEKIDKDYMLFSQEKDQNVDDSEESATRQSAPNVYKWNAKMVSNFFRVALMSGRTDLASKQFQNFVANNKLHIPGELEYVSNLLLSKTLFRVKMGNLFSN